MLDLNKHLERWFEKTINGETCEFLLRFYPAEKRIEHEKSCTVKSNKKSKIDEEKYVAKMLNWVIQDWKNVGGDCNAENKRKFAEHYQPMVSELFETSYLDGAFREHSTIELVKNYAGLSSIPNNGEPVKAEINQD